MNKEICTKNQQGSKVKFNSLFNKRAEQHECIDKPKPKIASNIIAERIITPSLSADLG